MYQNIHIRKHTEKQKAKETKENKKKKKKKKQEKKRRKKMLLLTISVKNLTEYNDIVLQFALCTFNLPDQPTKRERVLKNNKLVHVCLLFVQDEDQDMLMQ